MAEEIDYSSLITVENVEKIKNCKLLYATGSVLIYDLLSQMEQIGKYIPASYKLDTDDNIITINTIITTIITLLPFLFITFFI